jgi:cytochrome c-type biogenesis protein CcmF
MRPFVPILAPGIVAMVIGPVLAWRRGVAAARAPRPGICRCVGGPGHLSSFATRRHLRRRWRGIALAVWAMLGVLTDLADRSGLGKLPLGTAWRRLHHLPRGTWGYALAHFGVGVLITPVVVSTAWRSERIGSS